jgi:dTDP-4-amino-4,6-dideoxygalactose transaminase
MEPIMALAGQYGIPVIEDAAQAIGSEYCFSHGATKRAGSMGRYGCFSFFPSKNLGAFGDGGMVTTSDEEVYDRLKVMRVHGSKPKYYHSLIGGNFRLDALQAAVLLVKLRHLDEWSEKRMKNADLYRTLFREKGIEMVSVPVERQNRHIYNQFIIRVGKMRDDLKVFLNESGIGCEIYYPVPLHMQKCFENLGYGENEFPVSCEASKTTLALPIYPELTTDQIEYVVDMIGKFYSMRKV